MLTTEERKNRLEELLVRVRSNRSHLEKQRSEGGSLQELSTVRPVPDRVAMPAEELSQLPSQSPEPEELSALPSKSPEPAIIPQMRERSDDEIATVVPETSVMQGLMQDSMPESIEPEPVPVEPKPVAVEPEPVPVEPEPIEPAPPRKPKLKAEFDIPSPQLPEEPEEPSTAKLDAASIPASHDLEEYRKSLQAPDPLETPERKKETGAELPPMTEPPPIAVSSIPPTDVKAADAVRETPKRDFQPRIEASGEVAVVRGETPLQWTLRAVLERAWKLDLKE